MGLQYQQDYRTVSLISRDTNPLEVYACEFAIDNGHLGFVATDSDRNLSVFMYAPESPDSMGGHRLIRKGTSTSASTSTVSGGFVQSCVILHLRNACSLVTRKD